MSEVELFDEWPANGRLGRRMGFMRSMPKDELRRVLVSNTPERFSRSAACKPKPESFRETGVEGNEVESGEGVVGDGGELCDEP